MTEAIFSGQRNAKKKRKGKPSTAYQPLGLKDVEIS